MRQGVLPIALLVVAVATGCAPSRLPIAPGEIPPGDYVTVADEEYGQQVLATLMQQYPLERDDYSVNKVRDVVDRLARAAGADDAPWNVYVLRGDNFVNAAATRGNFVFVWTGLLNIVASDGELAAVLAHEMGHVLAGHTQPTAAEEAAEILANVGGDVAGRVVSAQGPYGALGSVAGMVAQQALKALVVNPESQRKEFEADRIGIFLMADAGYDPNDAISLWRSMSSSTNRSVGLPSFLSSHPADEERLVELEKHLSAAENRYLVALSFKPQPHRARRPQFEPDTFAVGREPVRRTFWRALESGTAVFQERSTLSRQLRRLRRDERITVGEQRGAWFEVTSPVRGYVLSVEIYPDTPR